MDKQTTNQNQPAGLQPYLSLVYVAIFRANATSIPLFGKHQGQTHFFCKKDRIKCAFLCTH